MLQLLAQIFAEQGGAGDRGRVDAGLVQSGEGTRRRRRRAFRIIFDSKLGIGEGAVIAGFEIGPGAVGGILREGFAQAGYGGFVTGFDFVEQRLDIIMVRHEAPAWRDNVALARQVLKY